MDFAAIGGPLISAGASLIGSKMTSDAANKAARLNAIVQSQENQLTRDYNERMYREAAARDERLQREFAQNGIQWRAADARAAGMHPLAALGAQTHSYSSSVGTPQAQPAALSPFGGSSMGAGVAAAGQDISRAIQATRTQEARDEAYTKTVQDLNLQKLGMENALLASQVAKVNAAGTPPARPSSSRRVIDGQGNAPISKRVKMEPMEVQYSAPGNPVLEPKPITEVGHTVSKNSPSKRYAPVMSDQAKDRLEEDMFGTLAWTFRNRILPMVQSNLQPPNVPLPKGKDKWMFHPITWEYMPIKSPSAGQGSRLFRRR